MLCWLGAFAAGLAFMPGLPSPQLRSDMADVPDPSQACAVPSAGPERGFALVGVGPAGNVLSLAAGCGAVDVVLADWADVDAASAKVVPRAGSRQDEAILRDGIAAVLPGRPVDLVVTLRFPAPLSPDARLLETEVARGALVSALMDYRAQTDARGLCLRLERMASNQKAGLSLLLADLDGALGAAPLCLVLGGDDSLRNETALLARADRLVIEAFLPMRSEMGPSDLAPADWFAALVRDVQASLPPGRVVLVLGSHAARWVDGRLTDATMPVAEALRLIARGKGDLRFDPVRGGSFAAFTDQAGQRHELALLDAPAIANQRLLLSDAGLDGALALAWAGTEDPHAWAVAFGDPKAALAGAGRVSLDRHVGTEGEGPVMRLSERAAEGERRFSRDATGRVTAVEWLRLPRPFTLERVGIRPEGKIALTFDDGPDPVFTAQILDILAEKDVRATFFLTGRNLPGQTVLLRRIVAEGHLVGSHTYSHLEVDEVGAFRLGLDLNMFQRLVSGATGRGTVLYRSPYQRTEGPIDAAGADRLGLVQDAGYIVVGSDLAPRDWEARSPQDILSELEATLPPTKQGFIVALHDAGGDRSATVAALGPMIDLLRARGYTFVPLTEFLPIPPDAAMPAVSDWLSWIDWLTLNAVNATGSFLGWAFWIVMIAGASRALVLLVLAHIRRRHKVPATDGPLPAVTVVISAFNEEATIGQCLSHVLALDWPDLRVLVIDDGSTDATAAVVRSIADPRLSIQTLPNGGKARALAHAYRLAETGLVLAIDADTQINPEALRHMVGHFADPSVGAVAGRVLAGRAGGLLTRLQALEYAVAQGIDRRAAESLRMMLVVPGAIGLWRRDAVLAVGGPSTETLAEDADLTVSLQRAGYRIVYEDRATAVTEVPRRIRGLWRQRLRWSFGMMQTAWKHRRATRQGTRIGLVALPDLWLFGVGLGLLAPLADLVLLGILAGATADILQGAPVLSDPADRKMLLAYLAMPALDLVLLVLALRFDKAVSPALILLLPLQRLIYRPILYLAIWRAVWQALSGLRLDWGSSSTGPQHPAASADAGLGDPARERREGVHGS